MRSFSRGPVYEAPVSRVAAWSARFAWFAVAVAILSIIIVRTGFLEIAPALATFAASLMFAGLAILLSFAAFIVIWRQGLSGLGRAVGGLLLGILLLAYPGYLGYRASKLPAINDITTDPANPPRFAVLARLRPRGTSDYPGARFAELQRKAYPDIEPLQYDAPAATVYKVALDVVTKRKWNILDQQPPAPRRPGDIEAVARTLIMGFRDDVVVRVTQVGTGTRLDVRSASRYGTHDFGTNARRVVSLLSDIDDAMDDELSKPAAAPKEEKEPPKKRTPTRRGGRR
ncbi:MAG TPA: DUF1499 domain-containing protein [Pseudolabrys sp.]|nr:DUF1499 domain-containing protein [Pseudolabrys sp.]